MPHVYTVYIQRIENHEIEVCANSEEHAEQLAWEAFDPGSTGDVSNDVIKIDEGSECDEVDGPESEE